MPSIKCTNCGYRILLPSPTSVCANCGTPFTVPGPGASASSKSAPAPLPSPTGSSWPVPVPTSTPPIPMPSSGSPIPMPSGSPGSPVPFSPTSASLYGSLPPGMPSRSPDLEGEIAIPPANGPQQIPLDWSQVVLQVLFFPFFMRETFKQVLCPNRP